MHKEQSKKSWAIIKRLSLEYLRPYIGQVIVTLFFMITAAAATAAFVKLLQPILDEALIGVSEGKGDLSIVWRLSSYIVLCFFVSGVSTYIHTIKMNKISQRVVGDIQSNIFSHFMGMHLSFFHEFPSGQLVSRITNDVNVMRSAVSDALTGIGKNAIMLLFLIAIMFLQDWKLALLSLAVFPSAIVLIAYIGKRLRKISKNTQAENAYLMETLIGIFQGIRQVQAYGMEDVERKRASKAVYAVRNLNIKAVRVGALSTPINEIMVGFVVGGIIVYGAYRISEGALTPGGLISFIAAFSLAYEPMKKLAKLNNSLQIGLGAAERVLDMMDTTPQIQNVKDAKPASFKEAEIEFKSVSFKYLDSDEDKALDNINFVAEVGKVTAFVGASGGGKTTIMNLVPRFYDVDEGMVSINGENIRNFDIGALRQKIALVSQDITIFDDSIAANISYGSPDASEDEIKQAAKSAAADIFIEGLPEGYNTRLGENGVTLSGGQRQRIAIARAMLRDAPILLLDEATSALDSESENLIQQTLKSLEKGRTTLVIAHRLSTIQNADKIIVVDNARIVEQGTHQELLDKNGFYTKLYQTGLEN